MTKTRLVLLLLGIALIGLLVLLDASKDSKTNKTSKDDRRKPSSSSTYTTKQTSPSTSSNSNLVSSNRNKKAPIKYQDKQALQLAISRFQRRGPKLDFIARQNQAASLFRAAKRSQNFSFEELNALELQLSSVVYHDDSETLQAVMAAIRQRQAEDSPRAQNVDPQPVSDVRDVENESQNRAR